MESSSHTQNMSNIQLELLKLYSTDVSDQELHEIKRYLAQYFAQQAIEEADEVWESKNLDNALMDQWLDGK